MLILIYLFILGMFMGSFLNVLIDRLPREESIFGRSHCEECKHKLNWNDLIPVISFLSLGGACRYCKKKFSWFYPFIEIFTGTTFLIIGMYIYTLNRITLTLPLPILSYSVIIQLAIYLFFICTCIVIFFADIKYHIIPDSMQVCFFIAALFFWITGNGYNPVFYFREQVIAAFAVMAPILLLFLGTKGRGMGFGDVKFAFNMGFLLGLFPGFFALYVSFIAGGIVGAYLLLAKRKKAKSHIAFGPFLLLGTLFVFFFREWVNLYLSGFVLYNEPLIFNIF